MPTILKWLEQQAQLEKDKGVGDTIKRITSSVGIKPCGGCEKRAEQLNKRFPYKRKEQ